jgi:uncharacterized protein (PEP-CTERM system associated)
MGTGTVEKTNSTTFIKVLFLLTFSSTSFSLLAGEWDFVPSLGLTETITDNVDLTTTDQQSSLVSQLILGIDTEFKSKSMSFNFGGTQTLVGFSHNSGLNDDYQTFNVNASFSPWDKGPQLILDSNLRNISENDADNSLSDLVSGNTIQQFTHNAGMQYNTENSDYTINSSIIYNRVDTEDNIGESQGYTALLESRNGNAARLVFWQINGQFTYRENNSINGENYAIESKIGAITPYKLNPFVRFYNEEIKGNIAGTNPNSIPSWGPGIRYLAAKHFFIDLSYNYVQDDTNASDDYVAANIAWQPSNRTSIKAGYSKRFFGDSYELDFSHSNKRLTNNISYHETIEAFDRNSFQENELGSYWCPVVEGQSSVTIEECFVPLIPPVDSPNYQVVSLSSITPIENNEFTLNKRLSWQSILTLSRTVFSFDLSGRERTSLSTDIVDQYLDASFTISRRTSKKSDINLTTRYSENTFDTNNLDGVSQKDIYKIISTTYNRSLASSLNAFITLQFLDRNSTRTDRVYTEARASINITKDF